MALYRASGNSSIYSNATWNISNVDVRHSGHRLKSTTTSVPDRPGSSHSDLVEPNFSKALAELPDAFTKLHRDESPRPEFTAMRTTLYSEAFMYSKEVHREALVLAQTVKETMRLLEVIVEPAEVMKSGERFLSKCESFIVRADRLVVSHAYVIGRFWRRETKFIKEM
jgi:hypothetical protein